jgi:hypothetical protein
LADEHRHTLACVEDVGGAPEVLVARQDARR